MDERRCQDLRVEYLRAPLAVGTESPRFSFLVDHAQSAYRITVRDGAGTISWDTGRVSSADTSLIPYAGAPLESDRDYFWTVESWDAAGIRAASESRFGTALFHPANWSARWVEPVQETTTIERWTLLDWIRGAVDDSAPAARLRPAQLLRQLVDLPSAPIRARLFATAHGVYAASVNGVPAGDEVLAPGFDSYRHRVSVQCYDVTDHLVVGQNVIGVALADGWWAGRFGITGSSAQFGDRLDALWQLNVEFADRTSRTFGSGESVVSAPSPWRYADLAIGECFDAAAVPVGWDTPTFDASAWAPARATDKPLDAVVPFTGEPVRRIGELPARSVRRTAEGFVVDFGQVVAGRVRIRLTGLTPGQRVTIEHTETLGQDGGWFRNIVGINKDQTDVYLAAGLPQESYEPTFTYHGFRYVRVSGPADLDAADIVAIVIGSDLEYTGSFATSDSRLARLHENVVWSQRGNFVSIPTDCPQREKVGWTGDAQVFAPASANNAIVAPFFSRWLANLRADQLSDGAVPITSPRSSFDTEAAAAATGIGAIEHAAGWSDAIALVPWTLYERYGDERVLAENIEAILRWVEFQRRAAASTLPAALVGVELPAVRRTHQALLWNTGDQFGDWLAPSTLEGLPPHEAILVAPHLTGELVGPMFQARTLTIASRITAVLGRVTESQELADRAESVRAAFAAEYVDEHGDLPVRLQGVYTLALAFDMIPEAVRQRTADRLAELVRARGHRLDTGFLSVPYLLDVLWDCGHRDLARRLLWQSEQPSWLSEVDAGATTIWESWDAVAADGSPRPVSFNHYAFGCVDDWLYRRVAGIAPSAPGYRSAVIEPDLDAGVGTVDAAVWTPYGRLSVAWCRDGDDAQVTCMIPHGIHASLIIGENRTPLAPGTSTHRIIPTPTPA